MIVEPPQPYGLHLGHFMGDRGFPWEVTLFWTRWEATAKDSPQGVWGCPSLRLWPCPWPRLDENRIEREVAAVLEEGKSTRNRPPRFRWKSTCILRGWEADPFPMESQPGQDVPPSAIWFLTEALLIDLRRQFSEPATGGPETLFLGRLRASAPWLFSISGDLASAAAAKLLLPRATPWNEVLAALAAAEADTQGRSRPWYSGFPKNRATLSRVQVAKYAAYDHLLGCFERRGRIVLAYLHGQCPARSPMSQDSIAKGFSAYKATLEEDLVKPVLVPLHEGGRWEPERMPNPIDAAMGWLRDPIASVAFRRVFGSRTTRLAFWRHGESQCAAQVRNPRDLDAALRALTLVPVADDRGGAYAEPAGSLLLRVR
ncbi:MAG: hypothetical protein ABIO70_28390 [Pseudomonadota bacterium]